MSIKKPFAALILAFSFLSSIVYARQLSFEIIPFGADSSSASEISLEWKEEWLLNSSSFNYNHNLARIACLLSAIAYVDADSNPRDNIIVDAYKKLGADPSSIQLNYNVDYESAIWGNDQCAFSLAHTDSILFVAVRGTPLNTNEWISNMNISNESGKDSNLHEGFLKATYIVQDAVLKYIKEQNLDSKSLRILITGHSRGAAISNLLAAQFAVENDFPAEHIFAYTFASPNVTASDNARSSQFSFIWNIVNAEDIVPTVPPNRNEWKFTKYGNVLVLANSWNVDSTVYEEDYLPRINACFKKIMKRDYYPFKTGSFIPTQISMIITTMNKDLGSYYKKFTGMHDKGERIMEKTDFSAFAKKESESEKPNFMDKITQFLSERTGGISNYAIYAANDMHTCETYLSYLKALSSKEAFSTLGSSQIIIKGTADGFVQDSDGNILLSFQEGRVKYNSIKLPVAARDLSLDKIAIGFPANQDFKVVLSDMSLAPSAISATVEHYDASGVLTESMDKQKFYTNRAKLFTIDAGYSSLERKELNANTVTGSEMHRIVNETGILNDQPTRLTFEVNINTEGHVAYGIHYGASKMYATLLASNGILKLGKMMDIQTGIGTQQRITGPLIFDAEGLFKCTWFFDVPSDEKFTVVPSIRTSLSVMPWRRLRIFAAGVFDFHIKDFNDYAFSTDVRFNNFSQYSITNSVRVAPSFQLGIRF